MREASTPQEIFAFFYRSKKTLTRQWLRLVRSDPHIPDAKRLSDSALVHSIPRLFDRIVGMLSENPQRSAMAEQAGRTLGVSSSAEEHAQSRIAQRYTLPETLLELSHFRSAVLDICDQSDVTLTGEGARLVHTAIDEAITTVAVEMEQAARFAQDLDRKRLLSVLQILPVAVFIVDAEGCPIEANAAADAIWGSQRPRSGVSSTDPLYRAWWPKTSEPLKPEEWPIQRALRWGEEVLNEELDILSFDEERKTILCSAVPIRDAAGAIVGGVSVHVDITERAITSRALAENAECRERSIGILGHDLCNPLASVTLAIRMLLQRADTPDYHREILTRVLKSSDRMVRMIRDLLDVTRVRSGSGIPIEPKEVDLHVLFSQVITELSDAYPDRSILLEKEGSGLATLDPDRLAQVASNLIGNAVAYSPQESLVKVAIRERGADIIIEVNNLGAVIPPDQMEAIFEPFWRGAQGSSRAAGQGLGLGLFIARQIVIAHGGSLTVKSGAAEEGTTFTASLPRYRQGGGGSGSEGVAQR